MGKLFQFLALTRPLFLIGGLQMYTLGAIFAAVNCYPLRLDRWMIGQCLVTCIQLMTHYANEYYDLESDRLNNLRTWFSGGSGILVSGQLAPIVALRAAQVTAAASLVTMFAAGAVVPSALLVGALGMIGAWTYSGPPLALARTGWGELSASLVVAGLVPLLGFTMQSGGSVDPRLLVILLPILLLHFAMLIVFQIPDRISDEAAGKQTLTVRVGPNTAILLHNLALILAFVTMIVLAINKWPGAQTVWLALPLAIWQIIRLRTTLSSTPSTYSWMTARALAIFALTVATWIAGLLILWVK